MPKKLLKRFLPSNQFIKDHPSLSFLGPILEDPNLFHLNRHSVSTAFLIGMFLAFFPAPGQMIFAGFVAFWVRCNLPIAIALVWISNPITIPPIFFATYKLGAWMLDTPALDMTVIFSLEWIQSEFEHLWKPLLLGSLVTGIFFSLSSYALIQLLWRFYVSHQWQSRREKRLKKRAKQDEQKEAQKETLKETPKKDQQKQE